MQSQHQKRRYTPAGLDQYQRGDTSSPSASAYTNGVAAGFLTARDTAVDTDRSERDAARQALRSQGFESDMHTARGFETDDYLSAVEPNTSRSTGTSFMEDDGDVVSRRGAPAYRVPLPTRNKHGGREKQDRSHGLSDTTSWFGYGERSSESKNEPSIVIQQRAQSIGSRKQPATHGELTGTHFHANGRQQAGQVARSSQNFDGGKTRRISGFRQSAVEDVFSYARHNRVEDLERMMDQGVPVDVRDNFGNTILIVACQNGHKRALKAALRHGADPNAVNARGNTALHFCYAFGYGATLGQYLMGKGANPSIRNRSGLADRSAKVILKVLTHRFDRHSIGVLRWNRPLTRTSLVSS